MASSVISDQVTAGHARGAEIPLILQRVARKNAMSHLAFRSNPVMTCFTGGSLRRFKPR
jgi:hypothetical protein